MNCNDGFHCPFQWLWFPSLHPKEKWWTIPMFFEIYPFIVFTSTLKKKHGCHPPHGNDFAHGHPHPATFPQAPCPLRAALLAKRWEEFKLMQLHLGQCLTDPCWSMNRLQYIRKLYSLFVVLYLIATSYVYIIYMRKYIYNVNIIYIVYNICMIN